MGGHARAVSLHTLVQDIERSANLKVVAICDSNTLISHLRGRTKLGHKNGHIMYVLTSPVLFELYKEVECDTEKKSEEDILDDSQFFRYLKFNKKSGKYWPAVTTYIESESDDWVSQLRNVVDLLIHLVGSLIATKLRERGSNCLLFLFPMITLGKKTGTSFRRHAGSSAQVAWSH
eukprot:TRINITY_DN27816_c0_g1_i1.p1 TRINITY_DN27816_c0_g1~~TRINITY_DN27816_c0_g1_i1.p1  ORF type:complete len:176 (+),score=3.57 TRINITY_DN27816_c0_g1_i1:321-848(+)